MLSNVLTNLPKMSLAACRRHPSNKGQEKQKGLWTHRTSSQVHKKHHWQHRGKQYKQYQKHKFNHFNYLNSSCLNHKLANWGKKKNLWEREAKATPGLPSVAGEVQALTTVIWEPEYGCERLWALCASQWRLTFPMKHPLMTRICC